MEKQEAINLMKLWRASVEMNGADSEHLDAFDMAIEALSEPSRQGQRDGLIKRQDAIDANCIDWCNRKFSECPYYEDVGTDEKICDGCDTVLTLKNLPPAQPERKTGEWERKSFYNDTPVCSKCGCEGNWEWDYCPICGNKKG